MAEPRKIFRIEETMAARRVRAPVGTLLGAPAAPRCAAVGGASGGDTLALQAEHLTRIVHELEAVTTGTEQSTGKILAAAEEIDQAANSISAAVKGNSEQGLAQDIRDRVIAIFEACNFQDVTSQRLAKVRTALAGMEQLVGAALGEPEGDRSAAVRGPPLEGDNGHASQSEVDSLFAASVRPTR